MFAQVEFTNGPLKGKRGTIVREDSVSVDVEYRMESGDLETVRVNRGNPDREDDVVEVVEAAPPAPPVPVPVVPVVEVVPTGAPSGDDLDKVEKEQAVADETAAASAPAPAQVG